MKDDLQKELENRGTAEISNGVVNQVTQALDETPEKVRFLMFGELQEWNIMPIAMACAKCSHHYFDTIEKCQERQKKDAVARGFTQVICPEQFV